MNSGFSRALVPKRLVWLALLAAVGLWAGRVLWLPGLGGYLVVADPLEPAQAVLPLAGAQHRAAAAARLVRAGYAEVLLITQIPLAEPGARARYVAQVQAVALQAGLNPERIRVVPGYARTTYAEAQNARAFLEGRGWTSLIVVTDAYHTRRARLLFRRAFQGSGITVRVRPAEGGAPPEAWWTTPEGQRAVLSEYLKLMAHAVGVR
ncbi:YdcF family protein [Marinithermus hydrothermalis]|uniref:DUF218 domain-containing protein n=1 Tax=Marinithermus hydrothermalis (strain DSM 14884 / JCM 11576 / T1) TaxID=869210 RepID=F2NQ58_MARHT|nr:ElyC/SanA/YdcF family protein [Marinithermus hydrothermalis]AEB11369.1 protein of unknown function DUF218 [Marinithermus hydrothermalis DSM 14884]